MLFCAFPMMPAWIRAALAQAGASIVSHVRPLNSLSVSNATVKGVPKTNPAPASLCVRRKAARTGDVVVRWTKLWAPEGSGLC